ncbi:MAG: acetate--CoA ligase family protein, partial [Desulfobacterales bacterium]|nr:acetate--CoA ligase family protein [Desulfobacterales bacterium]
MHIHEYQAKEIFSKFGIPAPQGSVVRDAGEAKQIALKIGGSHWVVKAQIHAGGRGKGGGVRVADTPEAVAEIAEKMFESHDCTLVEINPLVVTENKRLLALDAKIEFDDNALYRHK